MIEATEVGVTVGKATLLAPVTVRVDRRSVLTVRGRNGTGKSTLLRVLAGARQPTSGTVRIGDEAVDDRDRRFRRRVAAMIGLPPMAPDLTVRDHVLLVASTWMGDPSGPCAWRTTCSTSWAFSVSHIAFRTNCRRDKPSCLGWL